MVAKSPLNDPEREPVQELPNTLPPMEFQDDEDYLPVGLNTVLSLRKSRSMKSQHKTMNL